MYVTDSKNVNDSFLIREGEDLKYCQDMQVPTSKDCLDVSMWGEKTELCYETSGSGTNAYNLKFCWDCWPNVRDCEYSMHSAVVFGLFWLCWFEEKTILHFE